MTQIAQLCTRFDAVRSLPFQKRSEYPDQRLKFNFLASVRIASVTEVTMRGVVIWHCQDTRRAVVWCDDSGELAYASDGRAWSNPFQSVSIGDYVAFDLRPTSASRTCSNLRLIESGHAPELAGILHKMRPAMPESAVA
jgi:hypothetical protein